MINLRMQTYLLSLRRNQCRPVNLKFGWVAGTRTPDTTVNSRMLYQLSYYPISFNYNNLDDNSWGQHSEEFYFELSYISPM